MLPIMALKEKVLRIKKITDLVSFLNVKVHMK